ncbi:unnamed protein product, partial [marine sediment metagenome]
MNGVPCELQIQQVDPFPVNNPYGVISRSLLIPESPEPVFDAILWFG